MNARVFVRSGGFETVFAARNVGAWSREAGGEFLELAETFDWRRAMAAQRRLDGKNAYLAIFVRRPRALAGRGEREGKREIHREEAFFKYSIFLIGKH